MMVIYHISWADAHAAVFSTALDAFIAMFVMRWEIFPHFLVRSGHAVLILHRCKAHRQVSNGLPMEAILVCLHVSELGEPSLAVIELTDERFDPLMHHLVSSLVARLGESPATGRTRKRPLSTMSSLMGLQVANLGESLPAAAEIWLESRVGSLVDLEVGFLREGFGARSQVTLIVLFPLRALRWQPILWLALELISKAAQRIAAAASGLDSLHQGIHLIQAFFPVRSLLQFRVLRRPIQRGRRRGCFRFDCRQLLLLRQLPTCMVRLRLFGPCIRQTKNLPWSNGIGAYQGWWNKRVEVEARSAAVPVSAIVGHMAELLECRPIDVLRYGQAGRQLHRTVQILTLHSRRIWSSWPRHVTKGYKLCPVDPYRGPVAWTRKGFEVWNCRVIRCMGTKKKGATIYWFSTLSLVFVLRKGVKSHMLHQRACSAMTNVKSRSPHVSRMMSNGLEDASDTRKPPIRRITLALPGWQGPKTRVRRARILWQIWSQKGRGAGRTEACIAISHRDWRPHEAQSGATVRREDGEERRALQQRRGWGPEYSQLPPAPTG